jgi:hypothetical protein
MSCVTTPIELRKSLARITEPETGTAVGALVGTAVGALVGTAVGLIVGTAVRLIVETAVGLIEETAVGLIVRTAVGLIVGLELGVALGDGLDEPLAIVTLTPWEVLPSSVRPVEFQTPTLRYHTLLGIRVVSNWTVPLPGANGTHSPGDGHGMTGGVDTFPTYKRLKANPAQFSVKPTVAIRLRVAPLAGEAIATEHRFGPGVG